MHTGEIEIRQFGVEIGKRICGADRRQADFDQQRRLARIGEVQRRFQTHALNLARARSQWRIVAIQLCTCKRA